MLCIQNQNINSLSDYFKNYKSDQNIIEILDCSNNNLTDLEGCPQNVRKLFCGNNQLTSLKGCPTNLQQLYCGGNNLTSLIGSPRTIKILQCEQNKLKTLVGCPPNVKIIGYWDNPLDPEWLDLSPDKILQKVQVANFKFGIAKINNVIQWKSRIIMRFCQIILDKWYIPDKNGRAPYAEWSWKKFQEDIREKNYLL